MAAKSPNYPAVDLGTALARVQPVLQKENRNKMSRAVLAKHLGYNSLSGRSLTAIAVMRAYGLVEGNGDELKISDDAVDAIKAPAGSDARKAALERLATRPPLFKDLRADFPNDLPSEENIEYWLAKRGFTGEGAGKAAKSYLTTMRLVSSNPEAYYASSDKEEDEMPDQADVSTSPQRPRAPSGASERHEMKDDFSVLLQGRRLKINATVDAEGIGRLKAVLDKYEEILKLLQ
jgi:hypothetical protein